MDGTAMAMGRGRRIMWNYEKRLQYPVKITTPNAKLAQYIISQYGGPDGEIGASLRYLSQRFAAPYREVAGLLTDIGTEDQNCVFQEKIPSSGRIEFHPSI